MGGLSIGGVFKFFFITHAAEYGIEGAVAVKGDFAAYAGVAVVTTVELAKKLAFQVAGFVAGGGSAGKAQTANTCVFNFHIRPVIAVADDFSCQFLAVEIGGDKGKDGGVGRFERITTIFRRCIRGGNKLPVFDADAPNLISDFALALGFGCVGAPCRRRRFADGEAAGEEVDFAVGAYPRPEFHIILFGDFRIRSSPGFAATDKDAAAVGKPLPGVAVGNFEIGGGVAGSYGVGVG